MRVFSRLALVVLACTLFLSAPPALGQTDSMWLGEYFNNAVLAGAPLLTRYDPEISFIWGTGAPSLVLPADSFSVRWTRHILLGAGVYRFTARTDDGVRVFVDDVLVLDAWQDRAPDPAATADVTLSAGLHVVRVEYYEHGGTAVAIITWETLSSAQTGVQYGTWTAEYFNNPTLSGTPTLTQIESNINYNWGYNSPAPGLLPADNFGIRWTGYPTFNAGTYQFTINADDGVRLWIDNQPIIDAWFDSGFTPSNTATVLLGAGQHTVRVEFYERTEVAAIQVQWTQIDQPAPSPVPTAPPATVEVWTAYFYNNTQFIGDPTSFAQYISQGLDLNWGSGAPAGVFADNFAMRIGRQATFTGGAVRFSIRADDGVRFYVDGVLVLDEWHEAAGRYYFVDQTLSAGMHALTLEFYEATSLASLRFYWVYLETSGGGVPVNLQVNANLLNVRTGPGVSYPILGRAERGQLYTITGRSSRDARWVRIDFGGVTGWVNSSWTTIQGDQALIPVIPGT